jgi:hypothetical protein
MEAASRIPVATAMRVAARRAAARLAVLLAVIQLPAHGWGPDQFGCLDSIWVRESGWNELAGHPASAYGIPQADPGSKMAAEGSDWLTNPHTQIRWGEDYIKAGAGPRARPGPTGRPPGTTGRC